MLLSILCLRRPGRLALLAGALFAALGSFSFASGLLAWPVGAAILLDQALARPGRQAGLRLAGWAVAAAGVLGVYFLGYQSPGHHPDPFAALGQPLQLLGHLSALLGSGFAFGNLGAAQAVGSLLLLGVAATAAAGCQRREPVLFWYLVYFIGAAVLASLGRSGFGAAQALSSRYAWISCNAAALTVGLLWLRAAEREARVPRFAAIALIGLALVFSGASYVWNGATAGAQSQRLERGFALWSRSRDARGLECPSCLEFASGVLEVSVERGAFIPPPPPATGRAGGSTHPGE